MLFFTISASLIVLELALHHALSQCQRFLKCQSRVEFFRTNDIIISLCELIQGFKQKRDLRFLIFC